MHEPESIVCVGVYKQVADVVRGVTLSTHRREIPIRMLEKSAKRDPDTSVTLAVGAINLIMRFCLEYYWAGALLGSIGVVSMPCESFGTTSLDCGLAAQRELPYLLDEKCSFAGKLRRSPFCGYLGSSRVERTGLDLE